MGHEIILFFLYLYFTLSFFMFLENISVLTYFDFEDRKKKRKEKPPLFLWCPKVMQTPLRLVVTIQIDSNHDSNLLLKLEKWRPDEMNIIPDILTLPSLA